MPNEHHLSADDVEQAGRLLMPAFESSVRKELDSLRGDFGRAMEKQTRDLNGKLDRQTERLEGEIHAVDNKVGVMDDRLKSLEAAKAKVVMMWGIIAAVVSALATLAWHLATDWLFKKRP